jgi:ribonuclease P protein component
VRAVFADGVTVGSSYAVVHARRRDPDGAPRATVVAGRKVGPAVDRNRVKRRLRAVLAELSLLPGCDYVVVGRRAALHAAAPQLRAAVARQVAAAGDAR